MRDPRRIPEVLESIRTAWERYPDLRLGQLITNAVIEGTGRPDAFYVEDAEMVKLIGRHIAQLDRARGGGEH
jgi:uncharacterized protein YihD (DUF1040 family)